jgi:hypothetical protein
MSQINPNPQTENSVNRDKSFFITWGYLNSYKTKYLE